MHALPSCNLGGNRSGLNETGHATTSQRTVEETMWTLRGVALSALLAAVPMQQVSAANGNEHDFNTSAGSMQLENVVTGLDHPWSMAFLPDNSIIVTERSGAMRIVHSDGRLSEPLAGVPVVAVRGQGGLLDVALDPDFNRNRLFYFSFAEIGKDGIATSVARARLGDDSAALENVSVIFRQMPAANGGQHFGSRLVFDKQGNLFVTTGDRGSLRSEVQKGGTHIGKVIRIDTQGKPASGNPKRDGWLPEIWSIGHRNLQGAALHPASGKLWTVEHGARGGDEVNVPEAGKNYGWPVISYGREYSGAQIGEGNAKSGMEQPVHYWDPSIAPSGMSFYTGDRFPAWRTSLFVGALAGQHVARLELDGETIVKEEKLFEGVGRVRDVRQGPDGYLYLLIDNGAPDGRLVRVRPKA
jgi:glucose/arabinose dehydrogenase